MICKMWSVEDQIRIKKMKKGLILILTLCFVTALVGGAQTQTNLILDYDLIYIDSNLRAGDAGILRFVINNEGDQKAEKVIVWVPDVEDIYVSKRSYLGTLLSDETATISTRLDVAEDASTGLHILPVHVMYTGYDSDGRKEEFQERIYEIPFIIYGDPLFQITPSKTTYFKDDLDELNLEVLTMDSVKDLEATLSSSCVTTIGSSRKYVGDVDADQKFNITYQIKPTSTGACGISLKLSYIDESGSKVSDNVSIGLIVEEAGVDFRIVDISYEPTGPGQTVTLKLSVKNMGETYAEDTALSLSLTDPFTTADTAEKYIGRVAAGETVDAEFNLAVSWDAELKVYSIPLVVNYKVGGTSYSVEKDVGVDVGGQVILEIIKVESSRGSLQVDVANVGTRTAESVKATLIVGEGARFVSSTSSVDATSQRGQGGGLNLLPGMGRVRSTGSTGSGNTRATGSTNQMSGAGEEAMNRSSQPQTYITYKSDIKPTKQTTFTFDASISGQAALILEYNGANNQRVTQREQITVGGMSGLTGLTTSNASRGGTGITTYLIYGVGVLVIVFVAKKAHGKWKSK